MRCTLHFKKGSSLESAPWAARHDKSGPLWVRWGFPSAFKGHKNPHQPTQLVRLGDGEPCLSLDDLYSSQ